MTAALLVFLIGACVGSFVNVLIFRLPESQSIVTPRSRCRSCGRPLTWYENVPLLSFLALRGRCRTCGTRISVQYPLVELAVGLLFAGNFLLFARPDEWERSPLEALASPDWLVAAIFTTILLAIALTDLRTYIIPDELSVGGMVAGLLLSFLPGGLTPVNSLLGALLGGGLLLLIAWVGTVAFHKDAMGGGDIKMLAMIGAFVGWQGVLLTLFLGALLGSVIYGPFVVMHRLRERKRTAGSGAGRGGDSAALAEHSGRALGGDDPAADASGEEVAHVTGSSRPAAPDVSTEISGTAEELDRGLVPFGFFLAPAAALTFYLSDELVQAYLKLVGLSS